MLRDSSGGGGDIAMAAAPPPPHRAPPAAPAAEEVGNSNSGEERSSNRGGDDGDDRIDGGGGGAGGGSGGGGNYGGNRWPRPETIALLRIRSEMDSVFRDSTPKAPLWEEVSRKLAELGYHRSAKKCKEKFENVYKYHKRTKDGRTAKHDGKTYRFFEELEAFEGKSTPPPKAAAASTAVMTPALPWAAAAPNPIPHQIMATNTVPSAHGNSTINIAPILPTTAATTTTSINFTITPPSHHLSPTAVTPAEPISSSQPLNPSPQSVFHPSYHHRSSSGQHHHTTTTHAAAATAHLFSSSTSSSTASDEELEEAPAAVPATGTRKRKRKWKDFFHKLTKDVIRKQEELQKKFLETVEKLDRERLVREDAWRVQEMARINREHEVLIQERSTAAAKDAAVLAFLQKMSGGGGGGGQQIPPLSLPPPSQPPPQLQSATAAAVVPAPAHQAPPPPASTALALAPASAAVGRRESGSNGAASASRWPKVEVHALIALRTRLDEKYQENGPKGPLWEEISAEMKKIGYNRNAKRCKEKWENINKYFKKVKESNKRRPEDSKTCPYFHQLDALYREKESNHKGGMVMSSANPTAAAVGSGGGGGYIAANPLRAVEPAAATSMAHQPEQLQQWQGQAAARNSEELEEEIGDEDDEEEDYEDLETEDEDEGGRGSSNGGGFQVVQNRPLTEQ